MFSFFFFKQKTAYEMRISDWSSDVCSSDLHRRDLQAAAQLVDDQRGESLAFDVFGDDEERTARLDDGFQNRKHRLQVRQLLLVDEDVRVGEFDQHFLGVGDEVGRQIAAVDLHALDDIEFKLEALGLLDRKRVV